MRSFARVNLVMLCSPGPAKDPDCRFPFLWYLFKEFYDDYWMSRRKSSQAKVFHREKRKIIKMFPLRFSLMPRNFLTNWCLGRETRAEELPIIKQRKNLSFGNFFGRISSFPLFVGLGGKINLAFCFLAGWLLLMRPFTRGACSIITGQKTSTAFLFQPFPAISHCVLYEANRLFFLYSQKFPNYDKCPLPSRLLQLMTWFLLAFCTDRKKLRFAPWGTFGVEDEMNENFRQTLDCCSQWLCPEFRAAMADGKAKQYFRDKLRVGALKMVF